MKGTRLKIAGIILAAGEGKRFGRNKALAKIDGRSFLDKVSSCLREIGCDPLVVVAGSGACEVTKEAERLNIGHTVNDNWEVGQFSSLKRGLAVAGRDFSGAIISLVDHPFVRIDTYRIIRELFEDGCEKIIIPVHDSKGGHPIAIPKKIIDEIAKEPDHSTLREIIGRHETLVFKHPVNDPGILMDIDTQKDYEEALRG